LSQFVDVLCAEREETQAVGDELVGEDGVVRFDFYQVDGEGRDLGQDHAAHSVGEGEGGVAKGEVDGIVVLCADGDLWTRFRGVEVLAVRIILVTVHFGRRV
jgi:hypothetical protein